MKLWNRLVLVGLLVGCSLFGLYFHTVSGEETNSASDCTEHLEEFAGAIEEDGVDRSSVLSKHISITMQGGHWDCAKEIVLHAQKLEIVNNDLKNSFEMEQRSIVKEIAALRTVIESSLPMSTVTPAFQWAQSTTDILLNVKFSHKIDAPATLNVEASNVTILENQLVLHASDGRKNFRLDIELLKNVVPSESRYDMASVGRMTFTLRKAEAPSKWTRLLKNKEKKINQMHVWWEMADKHRAELDKLDEEENAKKKKKKGSANDGQTASADVSVSGESSVEAASTSDRTAEVDEVSVEEKQKQKEQRDALNKIDEDAKAEIKAILDDGKKRKQDIDSKLKEAKTELEVKAKLDKKEIDTEILSKREAVEAKARRLKEDITASANSNGAPRAVETS